MRVDIVCRSARQTTAACLLLSFLMISCAAVHNPALEKAREAYQRAREDPAIVRNAGAALDRAERALHAAEQLWTKEQDVAEVEHLAYIAEKKVEIARVTAQRRLAADEIEQARSAHR
jgi:ABC-type branched-subunit amino acid transport system ATPase component